MELKITNVNKPAGKNFWMVEGTEIVDEATSRPFKGSVWDELLSETLTNNVGNVVDVIIKESNGYFNVRGFNKVLDQKAQPKFDAVAATAKPVIVDKVKNTTTSKATPRTSSEITATELIRYATKLAEIDKHENFGDVCEAIMEGYNYFLKKLE